MLELRCRADMLKPHGYGADGVCNRCSHDSLSSGPDVCEEIPMYVLDRVKGWIRNPKYPETTPMSEEEFLSWLRQATPEQKAELARHMVMPIRCGGLTYETGPDGGQIPVYLIGGQRLRPDDFERYRRKCGHAPQRVLPEDVPEEL